MNHKHNYRYAVNRAGSILLITVLSLLLTISPALLFSQTTTQSPPPPTWSSKWHDGYQVTSSDKQFKMKFGGRIMYDFAFFFQDDSLKSEFGELNNGTEFRRVRFFNSGQIYTNIKYKLQLDFAGGKISAKDMWIMITKIPGVGNLKVGHFKEPFRLEALTSSKYMTFIERGLPIAMTAERNAGFMLQNKFQDDRLGIQAGIFRDAEGDGNAMTANDGYAVTARVSGLPLLKKDKNQLAHLGVAYSYRKPDPKEYEIKSRPENHLGKTYVGTGYIEMVDVVTHLGAEAALVAGPVSIQGEFVQSSIDTKDSLNTSYSFMGYYGQVSYFLTGEHRAYENYEVGFGRVSPKKNFGDGAGGMGAVEVAVRYSVLDLIDGKSSNGTLIPGGKLNDITIGINWHLNPATRIMMNYVMATLENIDPSSTNDGVGEVGTEGSFQMRFQIDF